MKQFLVIIILLSYNLSNAQHSERFEEILSELKEIESKADTIRYGNGKAWWISTLTTYEHNTEKYSTYTGRQVQYYRNGQIASEILMDKYGNILSWNGFDRLGNKTIESLTTEIDSDASDLSEFFTSEKHINFKRHIKLYKCSKKLGVCYLHKEGQRINGKKKGLWKTYSENGDVKKEKVY
ncbi:hypothetical protein DZC78_02350 [Olleya aquimaris]|uniref:MORN repeat protein n=1 Tax=Olleya sediminilitoris TaxID=2795739 RepID=A0ABS1WIN2_9FLAO|nr:hypothetical protein [Olleya sediminilitoris]AXO81805.1 hypothetical protein DZC78_02350 [Olleya aquimaris]MBL7558989.1 hypothetical protein [Olleya sediminilitoris]